MFRKGDYYDSTNQKKQWGYIHPDEKKKQNRITSIVKAKVLVYSISTSMHNWLSRQNQFKANWKIKWNIVTVLLKLVEKLSAAIHSFRFWRSFF